MGRTLPIEYPRIRALENDLAMTRYALIDLMPPEAQRILHGIAGGATRDTLWRHAERAAEELLALCGDAQLLTNMGHPRGPPRAACPLCRAESSSPYDRGFALPDGLTRHLLGTHNSRQCSVFGAAWELAIRHLERPLRNG